MSLEGSNGRAERGSPDVTASVMQRLGYRRAASAAELRAMRRHRVMLAVAKVSMVLAACALGAAWWMGASRGDRSQPAVGDALRGSLVQGAGKFDPILLGMPHAPRTSALGTPDATRVADAPAKPGETSPHVRSY